MPRPSGSSRSLRASATIAAARSAGISTLMPNIHQQEKRVLIAARQRHENLRYRSTIKTLTKRLETAVADGDTDAIATEHLALVRADRQGGVERRDPQEHGRAQEGAGRASRLGLGLLARLARTRG